MKILNKIIFAAACTCALGAAAAYAQPRAVFRNYPLAANIARLSGLPEWYVALIVPATASIRSIDGDKLTGFNLIGDVSTTFFSNNIKISWSVTASVAPGQTQPTITLSETASIHAGWVGYNSDNPQSQVLSTPEQFELDGIDPDQQPAPPQDPPPPPPPPAQPAPQEHTRLMNAAGGEGGASVSGGGGIGYVPSSPVMPLYGHAVGDPDIIDMF